MKEKTDELHTRYYQKFAKLKSNEGLLEPEIYKEIAKNLLNEYKTEYAIMHAADVIETERAVYGLTVRSSSLIPVPRKRFFLFFHRRENYAANQIEREMYVEIERFFNRREKAIERLTAALEGAEQSEMNEAYDQPEPTAEDTTEPTTDESARAEQQTEPDPAKPKGKKRVKPQPDNSVMPGQVSMAELDNDRAEQSDRTSATVDLSSISRKD